MFRVKQSSYKYFTRRFPVVFVTVIRYQTSTDTGARDTITIHTTTRRAMIGGITGTGTARIIGAGIIGTTRITTTITGAGTVCEYEATIFVVQFRFPDLFKRYMYVHSV